MKKITFLLLSCGLALNSCCTSTCTDTVEETIETNDTIEEMGYLLDTVEISSIDSVKVDSIAVVKSN